MTAVAAAPRRHYRWLVRPYSYIPPSVGGDGIDGNNAVLIGELIEVRELLHVVGILVLIGQKNDDRIVLLGVVALGQMNGEVAGNVIDIDFCLRVLRPQGGDE